MAAAEPVCRRRSRDLGELRSVVKSAASNYLYKNTKRSPMIVPVINEL